MTDPERVLLIEPPLVGAGFGACLLAVLNHLRFAEREGLTPVVRIGASCQTRFLDPARGNDVWEQYFEPVGPVSSAEAERLLDDPESASITRQWRRVDASLPDRIRKHPDSIFTWTFAHWRKSPPADVVAWFEEQRRKGRETVRRHVRVKPHVLDQVDDFFDREMKGRYVLGVHMRGTDLHYAPPISPAEYFEPIDRHLARHPGALVYLATDQVQYVELMRRRYPDVLIGRDCLRSETSTAPFELSAGSPYEKGEDVLIDILLLSRCSFLIRGASNVPEMAIYFSDGLECLDLSLGRRFAFGQDYMGRWSPLATRPAWEVVGRDGLERLAENADAQTRGDRIRYETRRAWAFAVRAWRRARRRMRGRAWPRGRT